VEQLAHDTAVVYYARWMETHFENKYKLIILMR
jgi:hypothetical protein